MGKRILIDTDILIDYVNGVRELPKGLNFITEVTLYEFVRGCKDMKRGKKLIEEGFKVIFHDNDIIELLT